MSQKKNIQNALDKAIRKRDQRGEDIVYEALAYNKDKVSVRRTIPLERLGISAIFSMNTVLASTPVRFMFDHTGLVKAIVKKEPDDLPATRLIDVALENGAVDFQEKPSTDSETEFQVRTVISACLGTNADDRDSSPVHRNHSDNSRQHYRLLGSARTLLASEVAFVPVDTEQAGNDGDPNMATRITDLVRDLEDDEDTKRVWTSWTL
ncbi:hypothetical protein R3P38DRAFT_3356430 [Favolaschia claudopus]|uniref:TACO1/YebC-like second and third domain-containing protein n=1 Tax=Favolaschia claudopus TaxID=2862362 RepID=A0AAW0BBV3_9AGAR